MASTNNIINTLGIGSGIDITSLVSQLVEVERAPQQEKIDTRTESLKAQISGYGQLTSALDTLQTAIDTLNDSDLFNARSVAVPSSDAITAESLDAGAQTGTYSVKVSQIATAQSLAMTTATQSERDAALGKSGTMTIRFGEWSYTGADSDIPDSFSVNADRAALSIEIEETDSLDSIAEKINDQDAGVQASVLKVDGKYQLMLTAPSGESNAMEITVDDASLSAFAFNSSDYSNVTETQQGQDAILEVNGLSVTRDSNQIDDVIEGFNFTLNKESTDALTFSITADKSAAEDAIREFVDAYNAFQETTQSLVGYTRDEDDEWVRGDLAGDSTARMMITRLRQSIGSAVPGLQSGFTALTNVGIRTERDGTLSISEDEFSSALSDNFKLFESLFSPTSSATNTSVTVNQGSFASKAVSGNYEAEITRDPTQGQVVGAMLTHDFSASSLDASKGNYSFKISVDGTESNLIQLTGNYASADELRADLQSSINGDSNIKAAFGGVDVLYDSTNNAFSFVSQEYGAISEVKFTQVGDTKLVGDAIGQADFDSDTDTFSTALDTSTGDYSFNISVDGVESGALQLTGTYSTAEEVRAAMQTLIDGDATLTAAGVGVDVTYDSETNRFSFASRTSGPSSTVGFTATGADIGDLGITQVTVGNLGTVGIELTKARSEGTAVTASGFDGDTDTFTTPLDLSTGGYSFKMTLDGVESGLIDMSTLSGSPYSDPATLAADLQTLINSDSELSGAGVSLTVGYDAANDRFTFTSDATGSASAVEFSDLGDSMAGLGVSEAMGGTQGVDVAGTINGVEGFGAGNVLLPDLDSDAYGLNLSVTAGATAQGKFEFSFSRGFAGELSNLIDEFTGTSGLISMREDNIQSQLDDLDEETTRLDSRMEKLNARLTAQFIAMETILDSLDTTSSQLEGLVDRLPFTSSS